MSGEECSPPYSKSNFCRCCYPSLNYPGMCGTCELTHDVANRMVYRAIQIPFKFWSEGKISWRQQEDLSYDIDVIVWNIFRELRNDTRMGQQSLLGLFQEKVLARVKDLLERHFLHMDAVDENVFRIIDAETVCCSKLN